MVGAVSVLLFCEEANGWCVFELVAVLSGGQWLVCVCVCVSWLLFYQEANGWCVCELVAILCELVAVLSGGQWLVCVSSVRKPMVCAVRGIAHV